MEKTALRQFVTKTLLVMKLTVLLVALSLQVFAKGHAQQRITLTEKNAPLEAVLKDIQKITGYQYLFQDKWKQIARNIDVSANNALLTDVLDLCFKDQPFTYTLVDKIIVVQEKPAAKDSAATPPSGPVTVTGIVRTETGAPLPGATVMLKGTKKGGITDNTGSFSFPNVPPGRYTLEISFVGYDTYETSVEISANPSPLTAVLKQAVNNLDEAQVIAYGEVSRRNQTGNVTTVKAADIEKQPVSNPLLALEGRVPGLLVTQTSGVAGSGIAVRVQGQNSIANGNDPLYVIDGVPYSSQMLPTTGLGPGILGFSGSIPDGGSNGGGNGNPLAFINPNDIESITILKDADATAIYGSRAANGALLITTRKGKAGKARYDFNVQQGWGSVAHRVSLLNSPQYLEMRHEAKRNDGLLTSTTDYDINGTWDTTRYTNWQKALIGNTSHYTDAYASISGGTTNVQYLVGGTFHRETSVFPGSFADQKGALHFNLTSTSANQRFICQISANYLFDNNQLPSFDLTSSALSLAPNAPALYNADGSLNWAPSKTGVSSWTNPLSYAFTTYQLKTKNLVSNATMTYRILPGLEFKANIGYTDMLATELLEAPLTTVKPENRSLIPRVALYSNSTITSWITEPQLSYKRIFGRATLHGLIGTTIQQNNNNGTSLRGTGYNSDAVLADINSAASVTVNSTANSLYRYNALFGRLNLIWDNEYVVDLNARRDGSSRFGALSQFHNFGSGALAWIFSNNAFIKKSIGFLSYGKLKGSYGSTGNDQIGDYAFLNLYQPVFQAVPYQGQTVLTPNRLTNPYLQWEETKKLQFGADLGFMKDRIVVSANYAINKSSNQLLQYNLPTTTGFAAILANFPATVQNTSWEFTLNTKNVESKDFKWTTNANLTLPQNKLIAFPGLATSTYATSLVVGQPLNVAKVFHYLGVDPATGVYQFADVNGKPTFSPQYGIDNTIPITTNPILYGGLQNAFSYKGIQLDFLFQFVEQKSNVAFLYGNKRPPGYKFINQYSSVVNRWQKAGDIATIERYNSNLTLANAYGYLTSSDVVYNKDASYIRLKNVSLSYSLPSKWCSRAKVESVQFYFHAQNLFTITRFKGLDPETQGSLPPLRTIVCGLRLSL